MPEPAGPSSPAHPSWRSEWFAILKSQTLPMILMVLIALAACKEQGNADLWKVTQCFKPLHDNSYARRSELFRDEKKGCWGQRWEIPQKYLPYFFTKSTDSEQINLYFDVVGIFNSEAARVPRHKRAWEHKVQIETITHAGFEVQRSKSKKFPMKGFKKTDRTLFGFDIYDREEKSLYRYVYLFSEEMKHLYARCLLPPHLEIEQMKSEWGCEVFTHVNNQFDITYIVPFSAMRDLNALNTAVLNHLTSFMLNQ